MYCKESVFFQVSEDSGLLGADLGLLCNQWTEIGIPREQFVPPVFDVCRSKGQIALWKYISPLSPEGAWMISWMKAPLLDSLFRSFCYCRRKITNETKNFLYGVVFLVLFFSLQKSEPNRMYQANSVKMKLILIIYFKKLSLYLKYVFYTTIQKWKMSAFYSGQNCQGEIEI